MSYDFDRTNFVDNRGYALTQGLFWELRHPDYPATFTLKEQDMVKKGVTYYSLKKIYLEIADITEYEFAMEVFGSWDHWLKIQKSGTIMEYVNQWRVELEIKLRSQAIKAMKTVALEGGDKGISSAKWIAEGKWKGSSRGRPSKEEVEREKKIHAGIESDINKDYERMTKDLH